MQGLGWVHYLSIQLQTQKIIFFFFHILHIDGSVSQELSDTYTGLRLTTISKSSAVFLAAVGRPAGNKAFLGSTNPA